MDQQLYDQMEKILANSYATPVEMGFDFVQRCTVTVQPSQRLQIPQPQALVPNATDQNECVVLVAYTYVRASSLLISPARLPFWFMSQLHGR